MNLSIYNNILNEIKIVSNLLCNNGWAEKNAGNLSVDITDIFPHKKLKKDLLYFRLEEKLPYLKNRVFIVTPSGSRFRDIAEDTSKNLLMIKMDKDGCGYYQLGSQPQKRPTSELLTHLGIHNYLRENKSDFTVVLHTHPTELIALSHIREFQSTDRLNRILISAHPEVFINLPDKIGFVKYLLTGTKKLAEKTLDLVRSGKSLIIWERHGAISIERDVLTAYDHIHIANKSADITLKLMMAGKRVRFLTKEEILEISSLFSKNSRF